MARPRKLIPAYRKHRASSQAFVELSGRRFYCGPHGTKASKAEYDRLVMEWLASGRSAAFGTPVDETTISELAADYLKYAKHYYGDQMERILTVQFLDDPKFAAELDRFMLHPGNILGGQRLPIPSGDHPQRFARLLDQTNRL